MTDPASRYARPPWERHFQTFVGITILAIGTWVISSTQDQTIAVAVQTQQIKELTKRIDALSAFSLDRYTSKDAERDFALRDAEMTRIWQRLRTVEERRQ